MRAAWAFVVALDLQDILKPGDSKIGSAASVEPTLMVTLWLWATTEGVGSARHLEKLCSEDLAYRWLCGGVANDHNTLRQFRVEHGDALDRLLACGLATLVENGLINLELLSPAALEAQGSTGASLARRRLQAVAAAARIEELHTVLDRDDPIADERYNRAVRGRIAQQQQVRVNAALAQMKEPFTNTAEEEQAAGVGTVEGAIVGG